MLEIRDSKIHDLTSVEMEPRTRAGIFHLNTFVANSNYS